MGAKCEVAMTGVPAPLRHPTTNEAVCEECYTRLGLARFESAVDAEADDVDADADAAAASEEEGAG